jgi:hypothetical protein
MQKTIPAAITPEALRHGAIRQGRWPGKKPAHEMIGADFRKN